MAVGFWSQHKDAITTAYNSQRQAQVLPKVVTDNRVTGRQEEMYNVNYGLSITHNSENYGLPHYTFRWKSLLFFLWVLNAFLDIFMAHQLEEAVMG